MDKPGSTSPAAAPPAGSRVSAPGVVARAPSGGFVTPVGAPTEELKPAPSPRPLRGPAGDQVTKLQPPSAARISPSSPTPERSTQGEAKSIQVGTIYFNDGSARLSGRDVSVIEAVSGVFNQTGGRVRVVGHSSMGARTFDNARREAVNYQMSLKRANAVANALMRLGVPADSIEVIAEGDQAPIYAETSQTGAAHNRRAEIFIDYVERS